jgi:hypothetical protein
LEEVEGEEVEEESVLMVSLERQILVEVEVEDMQLAVVHLVELVVQV